MGAGDAGEDEEMGTVNGPKLGGPRREGAEWLILALACAAQFMVVLDVSVVNVALPSIGHDLHYNATGLQWVVNAYVLTFAGFLLLGGRAADLYGRRRVFLLGLVVFTAASLVGGFAQSAMWLTAARTVQGVGGAILSPATLTIIVTTFSKARLTRALGLWSAMGGAGGAAGVLLGGVLTAELSWRWVLFINVPIGLVTGVVALLSLGEARGQGGARHLDVLGAVTVTGGLAALVYAIVGTDVHPWVSAQTLTWLAVAVVLLTGFVIVQRRSAAPLVPFGLFRIRAVVGANLTMLFVGAAFFSMWYFLSLFLQDVLHYGPLATGFAFLPMGIAIILGAQISSRVLPRIGIQPLLAAGTIIATAGYFWLAFLDPASRYWSAVFGPGLLVSFALGLLFTPLASAATAGVARTEAGLASGLLNTSRQMGGSLGLALLATIASSRTHDLIGQGTAATTALADGFARAFSVGAALMFAAFVVSWIVGGRRTSSSHSAIAPTLIGAD